jgi:hypothetical protein
VNPTEVVVEGEAYVGAEEAVGVLGTKPRQTRSTAPSIASLLDGSILKSYVDVGSWVIQQL